MLSAKAQRVRKRHPLGGSIGLGAEGLFQPTIDINGFTSASFDIGVFEAGIKGELVLLEVGLPFRANVAVTGRNDVAHPESGIQLTYGTNLGLHFAALDGRVSVFVDYLFDSSEWTLVSWRGLRHDSTLISTSVTFPFSNALLVGSF